MNASKKKAREQEKEKKYKEDESNIEEDESGNEEDESDSEEDEDENKDEEAEAGEREEQEDEAEAREREGHKEQEEAMERKEQEEAMESKEQEEQEEAMELELKEAMEREDFLKRQVSLLEQRCEIITEQLELQKKYNGQLENRLRAKGEGALEGFDHHDRLAADLDLAQKESAVYAQQVLELQQRMEEVESDAYVCTYVTYIRNMRLEDELREVNFV